MTFFQAEIDYIIYHYLKESNFAFTAHAFRIEHNIRDLHIKIVPEGTLINIIEKGIKYAEFDFNKNLKDENKIKNLSLLEAINPDVIALRDKDTTSTHDDSIEVDDEVEIPSSDVIITSHNNEVYICAWNPTSDLLATGAGDSTAMIWNMNYNSYFANKLILTHTIDADKLIVTSLEWNNDGSRLATGTYDGYSRIWTTSGHLDMKLGQQKGPIFSLKWNKNGNYILSAGRNKIKLWDTTSGLCTQKFKFHTKSVIEVDWMNNKTFASCSTDKYIYVCSLDIQKPIITFQGHTDKINAIQWDPQGSLLASCSDDGTLKIWNMQQDTCVQNLQGHSGKIYMIKWSPTGTNNPNVKSILASASEDSMIRLWDAETWSCINILSNHTSDVYNVSFSPDGRFLASGSSDKFVYIWSTENGNLVHSYESTGIIWNVCWNRSGNKVGAAAGDGSVYILDLYHLNLQVSIETQTLVKQLSAHDCKVGDSDSD